jgi:nucleotide-binding universal stress UspA family protein
LAHGRASATTKDGSNVSDHAICVAAERDEYDTMLVGRRNLHDAGSLRLGMVAARVVSGAPCDVVVVA